MTSACRAKPCSRLPTITHLQFFILWTLSDCEEMRGEVIRERLDEIGSSKKGPNFYMLMARIEAAGLVKGWYGTKVTAGQIRRERWYRLTPSGARAMEACRDFYAEA